MLKIETDKKSGEAHIEFGGSMETIVDEMLSLIHAIHAVICKDHGVIAGITFQMIVEAMITECMKPQEGDNDIIYKKGGDDTEYEV